MLVERVPFETSFLQGSTYVASIERQLPGAIAVAVFGPPTNTASFEFRRLIGFSNPDAGFGFSLPSEGYLNFGLGGVLAAALMLGGLLGYAARRTAIRPTHARHLLYAILLATLPLSFRSDALQQIKTVLYPMLLSMLVLRLASSLSSRHRPEATPGIPTNGAGGRRHHGLHREHSAGRAGNAFNGIAGIPKG